jgi:hypothetical protein
MSKSPFYLPGMTGAIGNISGPLVSSKTMQDIRRKGAIQKAALQSGLSAGQVDASNIQDFGYSKYGDIAAKGFENYQGDDNLYYSKRTGRTTARDDDMPGGNKYVLGEGEKLEDASSDSEIMRRRGMIDLNPQEELTNVPPSFSSLNNIFNPQAQAAIGGVFGSLFDRQNSVNAPMMFKINK